MHYMKRSYIFFFSSRRRHTRWPRDWSSVVCSSDLEGYGHQGTMYDLIHEYEQDDTLSASIPEIVDVTFSLLQSHEQEDFVRFLHDSFPGRWEYEAIHYFKYGGTGREFVVLKKAGRIIGFCRINDAKSPFIAQNVYWSLLFNNELGGVGPLGIDDKERGQDRKSVV